MIQTEDLSYKITSLAGKGRSSVKTLWKNISRGAVTLEGEDLGQVAKNKTAQSVSLAPAPAPPSPFFQGLALDFCSGFPPLGHGHALPDLLLNRRSLFYSGRSLCSKQALGGQRGGEGTRPPVGPCTSSRPFTTIIPLHHHPRPHPASLLNFFFPLVEHGHKI